MKIKSGKRRLMSAHSNAGSVAGRAAVLRALFHLLVAIFLAACAPALAAQTTLPEGVPTVHSNQRPLPAGIIIDDTLRKVISAGLGGAVEIYTEFLDTERFVPAEYDKALAEFLRRKYSNRNIRVIVAVVPQALQFLLDNRYRLFPRVPIVHLAMPKDLLPKGGLPPDVIGSTIDLDPFVTFELALRLQPQARRLVIVTGASERDRVWERRIRDAVTRFGDRLPVEYLRGQRTEELLRRMGTLSRDTIVYTPGYFADGSRRVITPRQSVEQMAAASTAPIYGGISTFVGAGAVGGYLSPYEDQAKQAGALVVRLMTGTAPAAIAASSMKNVPVVDWRQLRRWDIDERLLPPDAVVMFRDPSVWDAYHREISIAFVVVVLQAVMISLLLLQRARRRRTEADLLESQQLMELAASAGELGMWGRHLSTGRVWVNPTLRNLFGLGSEDELQIADLIARIHPDDRARVTEEVKNADESGKPFEDEFRVVQPDGGERWVLAKGRTIADSRLSRNPGRMGVVIDITGRKLSDELLKNERAFLRQVIDIDPNLIFAKDREGRFTLVNQAVADVFGTTVENIVGKRDADFNPNIAEVEHFRRVDLGVMNSLQEHYVPEEVITTAHGNTLWLQTVKRPILDADGRASQVLGSATDITRRKEAEQELARQRNELAHLSRVSALGQLSASIAHQLNQPLAAILGNAEAARQMLAREPVDLAELIAICDDIVSEDHRAAEVIRRLRELFMPGEAKRERLDLNELVRDTLDLLGNELLTRHVTVVTELAPSLPAVSGGRVQLQQVLLNLLLNAADAMFRQADGRIVTIRSEAAGGDVRLSVVDGGPGIAAGNLKNVFEAFWSTKQGGMGIGLAICKTIVEAHNGRITAENNSGGGTSFRITLPALEKA